MISRVKVNILCCHVFSNYAQRLPVYAVAVSGRLLVGLPTNEAKCANLSTRTTRQWRMTGCYAQCFN